MKETVALTIKEKDDAVLAAYDVNPDPRAIMEMLKDERFRTGMNRNRTYKLCLILRILKKHNRYFLKGKVYPKEIVSTGLVPHERKTRKCPKGVSKEDYQYCTRWAKTLWCFKQQGSKCKECGHADPRHLVYHHRDGETKIDSIARMHKNGYTKQDVLDEIAKCDLLCVHCHKNKHIQIDRLLRLGDHIKDMVNTMDTYFK